MNTRIFYIATNTFREAVRDRVLYNLIAFALLMTGAAVLVGQISIDIEKLVVINLGLTAVSLFGIVIAIFIGIGLVSKEIEKRTLYTVLSRPVRRWEFIAGKFFGLAGTLVVNTACMAIGVFAALAYVAHHFERSDAPILVAARPGRAQPLRCRHAVGLRELAAGRSRAGPKTPERALPTPGQRGPARFREDDARHRAMAGDRSGLSGAKFFGAECYQSGCARAAGGFATHRVQHGLCAGLCERSARGCGTDL